MPIQISLTLVNNTGDGKIATVWDLYGGGEQVVINGQAMGPDEEIGFVVNADTPTSKGHIRRTWVGGPLVNSDHYAGDTIDLS